MTSTRWSLIEAIARSLHASGAPVHHIENALARIVNRWGLTAEISATPTAITLHIDDRSRSLRVDPGGLDLGRLSATWRLVANLLDERGSEGPTAVELARWASPTRVPPPQKVATALIAMSAAVLLGGSSLDMVAAGLSATATWMAWNRAQTSSRLNPLADAIAGAVAAALAGVASSFGASSTVVVVASVLSLLPGLSLVAALSEVAARSWNAGVVRGVGALSTLALLSGGITLGQSIAPNSAMLVGTPLPSWTLLPAAMVITLASMIQLGAPRRDWAPALVTGTWTTAICIALPTTTGTLLAAVVAGLAAAAWSRRTFIPAQSIVIAGILPMVPGSVSLNGAIALFAGDPDSVTRVAVAAATTGLSIVGGLLIASAIAPNTLGRSYPSAVTTRYSC